MAVAQDHVADISVREQRATGRTFAQCVSSLGRATTTRNCSVWKKVGLIKAGTYKGLPVYNPVPLSDEGPTPSRKELFALRQAEAAEWQKNSERADAARFR